MKIEEQIQKLGFEKQPPLECFFNNKSFLYKRDNFFITNHNFSTHEINDEFVTVFYIGKKQRQTIYIDFMMFDDLEYIEYELKELVNN